MQDLENSEIPLFPISVAARILEISVHTLRMYEKEGLIVPFKKESSHRLYSKSDIDRLICIRKAINESKISISGIKTIYSLIPCWDITNCDESKRENCEAYRAYSKPCWTFKEDSISCSKKKCRDCKVYKNFAECRNIKESIISLSTKDE